MPEINFDKPWVSFCISTYKRPELLSKQLSLLLNQTEKHFEIVISDNDPDRSAQNVVEGFGDSRVKYFSNQENMGMIRSFNKSIERSATDFIVMVTDDDPININFLSSIKPVILKYPGKSLYGAFGRVGKADKLEESVSSDKFIIEILDPEKTDFILWSGCVLKKSDVMAVGKIPEFGSPHLADHAFLALTGSVNGAVMINTVYSDFSLHDNNFSKFNFDYYTKGCSGFYGLLSGYVAGQANERQIIAVIKKHIYKWFISNIFSLKKFYALRNDKKSISEIDKCSRQILSYPFMSNIKVKYFLKSIAFFVKNKAGLLC